MSKSETEGFRAAVGAGLARLPPGATLEQQFRRIGTALLGQREYSMQEAAFILAGLELKGSSRSVVKIGVGFPEHRTRILRTDAMRRAQQGDEEADGQELEEAAASGVYEKYSFRPNSLDALSMYNFTAEYSVDSKPARGIQLEHPMSSKYAHRRT